MKGFKISAITQEGEEALKQMLEEDKKEPLVRKLLVNRVWSRNVISENPIVIEWLLKDNSFSRFVVEKDVVKNMEARIRLTNDKAFKDIDYNIEAIE